MLPKRFLKFWYPNSFIVFVRSWHNLIMIVEEDLAVTLMWRLLFTPLFHDSTIIGRVISFFFRLTRVIFGLFGYFFITLVFLLLSAVWFLAPIIVALAILVYLSFALNPEQPLKLLSFWKILMDSYWYFLIVFVAGLSLFVDG